MNEPYVSGALWGFMLPVGYVAAASGVAVILYPRSTLLRKLGFGYLLMLIGFFIMFSLWAFPRDLFINLLRGAGFSRGWIDFDYSIGMGAAFWLSLASIGAGLSVKASKVFSQQS